ncbi:MAG: DUF4340 domain-containing protein [Bacteroidales bacterium]|nr:DUF4340 domain-containing protein [Bacteroidales bacterium]
MKKKKNNHFLWILLAVVVVLIAALEIYERYGDQGMTKNVTNVNTEKITRIALSNAKNDQYLSLRKEESGLFITSEKIQIPIEDDRIQPLMLLLTKMTPIERVSTNSEDNEQFETMDEMGLRVTAYHNKEILTDFFIGKTMENENHQMMTYVRQQGTNDIYKVQGDLRTTFAQNFLSKFFLLI